MKTMNLVGMVFGRLTVTEYGGKDHKGKNLWSCVCECGNVRLVLGGNLRAGYTQSCGCLQKEKASAASKQHGMSYHPAWHAWREAWRRTTNDLDASWEDYGGRGITMCDEWKQAFENFWLDMGPSWKEGLTLDRIDVNGDYCKENCRWTTMEVQIHNKRKRKNCYSKYIGVDKHSKSGKFRARIRIAKQEEALGLFFNELDAATAYDNRSEQLYGDRPNGTTKIAKEVLDKSVEE